MLEVLCVPAVTIEPYRRSTNSVTCGVDPEVTFLMVVRRWDLSPGLILSGL